MGLEIKTIILIYGNLCKSLKKIGMELNGEKR